MQGLKMIRSCPPLAIGWLLLICLVTPNPLHAEDDGNMVALVNGAIIYQRDLANAVVRYYHPLGGAPVAGEEAAQDSQKIKQQLLENLIDRELLIQEARRQGMTIGTARVLRRIERLPEQMRPEAAVAKAAVAKAAVAGSAVDASGAPSQGVASGEDAFFRYVHEGLLIERLLDKELPKIPAVSEKRARAYYEQNPGLFMHPEEVHLRHILIQAPPEMAADARQQAYLQIQALAQQLAEGANFTALAIDASQCPSHARGGDLGYLTRQQLYPSLAQAAFDLAPGQVSTIVESPEGFHLLLVTDRRPARQLSFLLVRDDLQKQMRTKRLHKAARSLIRQLREKAAIERFLR